MRLPNQRFPALRKRISRPIIGPIVGVFSLSLIFIAGCASGTSGMSRVTDFFSSATPEETPVAIPAEAPTPIAAAPTQSTSPSEEEATGHPGKKTVKQARAASENAAAASKAAANASAAAALASKQAATASKQAGSVANQIQGSGPTNADVSLETGLGTTENTQTSDIRSRATPVALPSADSSSASIAPVPGAASTLSSPALESSASPDEANPAKAAKLIQDIDKIERQVDRKNLTADDSQRDILAQKLLQEARKALAERDSVAAISLATKASTLLSPLPKLAGPLSAAP